MQPIDILVPDSDEILRFVILGEVGDSQMIVAGYLAVEHPDFPVGITVGLVPVQPYVTVFHHLDHGRRMRIMLTERVAPYESRRFPLQGHLVRQPLHHTDRRTDQRPHGTARTGLQLIFQFYFPAHYSNVLHFLSLFL